MCYNRAWWYCGGIGRHEWFGAVCLRERGGSNPPSTTFGVSPPISYNHYNCYNTCYNSHTIIGFVKGTIALFFFYYEGRGMYRLSQMWPSAGAAEMVQTIRPLSLILCLTMLAFLLDASPYHSRLLSGLGKYSYEIYLLHSPFMAGYDFFLFRTPLLITFYAYCMFILLLSFFFKRATGAFNRVVFNAADR